MSEAVRNTWEIHTTHGRTITVFTPADVYHVCRHSNVVKVIHAVIVWEPFDGHTVGEHISRTCVTDAFVKRAAWQALTRAQALSALNTGKPVYDRNGAAGYVTKVSEITGYCWQRASDGVTFTYPGIKRCDWLSKTDPNN